MRRSIQKRIDTTAGAATTFLVAPPSWAETVLVHVLASTAGASSLDISLVQDNPDGSGADITLVAAEQVGASATDAQRYLGAGFPDAIAGTNYDATDMPLSSNMKCVIAKAGTVSKLKVWFEFLGQSA